MSDQQITLTQDETEFVRVILREDTDYDPEALVQGQQLVVGWPEAQDLMEALTAQMTQAMADAHDSGDAGHLDAQHETVQSVNQKLIDAFRGQTDG